MSDAGITEQDATHIGTILSGQSVISVSPVRAGGNNRVFCLNVASGSRFALKYYPPQSADKRDRLSQEYAALSFLSQHGLKLVPRPIAKSPPNHCALYEWFEGESALLHPQADDVDQLARFLIDLQRLCQAPGAHDLCKASAGIFSPSEAFTQFENRLQRLRKEAGDVHDLRDFLDNDIEPTAATARRLLETRYRVLGLDPSEELVPSQRALSPSDFGLHNTLRGADGRLRFIDFEYFGWDDPVKMACDAAIHPGSNLPDSAARRLVEQLSRELERSDPTFAVRCALMYTIFGLIWCLIILNDFVPGTRSRRVIAGQGGELKAVQARQLEKARRLHQAICQNDPDITPR